MRKSATNDDVLSTREAAERLGVALRTVQLWVEGGVLPAWKTAGGHRRISRIAVEKLIDERRAALAGGDRPPEPRTPAGPLRLRVLVVEDEPAPRELMRMMIEGWQLPVDVSLAADGFDALLQIGRRCPDLLITDLDMPGMDGFRMIESLRGSGANAGFDQLEIVVVTALDDAQIAARGGLDAGVTLMRKPVAFDELEQRVRHRLALALAAAGTPQVPSP